MIFFINNDRLVIILDGDVKRYCIFTKKLLCGIPERWNKAIGFVNQDNLCVGLNYHQNNRLI